MSECKSKTRNVSIVHLGAKTIQTVPLTDYFNDAGYREAKDFATGYYRMLRNTFCHDLKAGVNPLIDLANQFQAVLDVTTPDNASQLAFIMDHIKLSLASKEAWKNVDHLIVFKEPHRQTRLVVLQLDGESYAMAQLLHRPNKSEHMLHSKNCRPMLPGYIQGLLVRLSRQLKRGVTQVWNADQPPQTFEDCMQIRRLFFNKVKVVE